MIPQLDLVVRGVEDPLDPDGEPVDLGIADGVFVCIEPSLSATARREIDARGLCVLPGGVDPHVHFNEPGERAHWEGFATGSDALAVGGFTTTLEMPLNASPPTVSAEHFQAKRRVAERVSRVDFGLWAGVVPANRGELGELAACGAVGFKAFMSDSGVADFPACDDLTLYEAMTVIATLGLPLAVHAESDVITRRLAGRARAAGRIGMRDYLASRPAVAETEAISRAIELATVTGCPLHVVHVSTGRGVALVAEARARGVDVSCEVTPAHLILTEEDAVRLGAVAKCAPPLRPPAECEALWVALQRGDVAFVASDHSPSAPELRAGPDAFHAWGGIAGCQSTLELLLTEGHLQRRLSLGRLAEVVSRAAARRFALAGKGELALGMDADLVLVDLQSERVLQAGELHYRHAMSPYLGRTLRARVQRTILRGVVVHEDGALVGEPGGRLVTPASGAQNPSR